VRAIFIHALESEMDIADAVKLAFDSAEAIEAEMSVRWSMKVAEVERKRKALEKASGETPPDVPPVTPATSPEPDDDDPQGEGAAESESDADGDDQDGD
jgi:hypothetical protein